MEIPYICGEYAPLFRPEHQGNYVNDHCIVRHGDTYHLFGITSHTSNSTDERYFVHATGDSLTAPFGEMGRSIDWGRLAWAPCVVPHEGKYYMLYGPSPTCLAVSTEMYEWFGHTITIEDEPVLAMHRDHFVLRTDSGDYLLYTSGVKDGRGCISIATSTDLVHWKFRGYALTADADSPLRPAWGAMESPFVVRRGDWYYLFITYTDCYDGNYNNTLVFASQDPMHFGCYMGKEDAAVPIAELYAHAPEILQEDGRWYITTCGWANKPSPHPGCVSIAELQWRPADAT